MTIIFVLNLATSILSFCLVFGISYDISLHDCTIGSVRVIAKPGQRDPCSVIIGGGGGVV